MVVGRSQTQVGCPHANSHKTCHAHVTPMPHSVVILRNHFQNGMVLAWYRRSMVCVNQTQPHCVNQMGMTQSKPLVAWQGNSIGAAWYV
jgi:hypothetical protein